MKAGDALLKGARAARRGFGRCGIADARRSGAHPRRARSAQPAGGAPLVGRPGAPPKIAVSPETTRDAQRAAAMTNIPLSAPHRALAARRPLRRQTRAAAPAAVRIRPDAPARAGRGGVVHRPLGRRLRRVQPLSEAARGLLRSLVANASPRPTRRPSRTSSAPPTTTSRRWSTGSRPVREPARAEGGRRVRALRLHQRGHQQHQPCADAQGGAREVLLPALDRIVDKRSRDGARSSPTCRCSAAPTARPPAPPRWARRSPTWWRARARTRPHRRGEAAGQDERRGGQLQRPPRGPAGLSSTGRASPAQWSRAAARASPSTPQHPDRAARLDG